MGKICWRIQMPLDLVDKKSRKPHTKWNELWIKNNPEFWSALRSIKLLWWELKIETLPAIIIIYHTTCLLGFGKRTKNERKKQWKWPFFFFVWNLICIHFPLWWKTCYRNGYVWCMMVNDEEKSLNYSKIVQICVQLFHLHLRWIFVWLSNW